MLRLGRDGEVRGTMTGRDELVEPGRPPPTLGETGCRTKGEDVRGPERDDELRVLGRVGAYRGVVVPDDEPRVVGIRDGLCVLGRLRPLCETLPELAGGDELRRTNGLVLGSTRVRVPLPLPALEPEPPPPTFLPGR